MKKHRIISALLLFCCTLQLLGQRPLSAAVDRQQILIGEPIQLYLKGIVRPGAPWFDLDTIPHFEILQRAKIDTQVAGNDLFLQQTLTLTSWDSGRWQLPALPLGRLRTAPLTINVTYSPMNPDQPYHDIKDILEVDGAGSSSWYWYLIGIAVLIALFMLFFPPSEKKKVSGPPVDVFRASLQRLDKLSPSGEPRAVYTELIAVFRFYLEERHGIASASKTTEDLALQLKEMPLSVAEYQRLVAVLELSDFVKFARYRPSDRETGEAIEVIRDNIIFIEKVPHAVRVDTRS
jgi:hypothetical protein